MTKDSQRYIAIVVGTRPEIIKMAPVVRFCMKSNIPFCLIHTGQHYSFEMDRIFFQDLELPEPDYNLEVGSGSHGKQTAKLLAELESVFIKEKLLMVLVEGDTNSVLAGGLAGAKLNIPVGHVEAGLRSYDRNMPEEINRILVDHLSSLLFAPTEQAKTILLNEGISKENVFVTGNTIVDAVYQNQPLAEKRKDILNKFDVNPQSYFLLTMHRQENVDQAEKLRNVFIGLHDLYCKFHMPIIYPVHPRTKKRLSEFKVSVPDGVVLTDPIGYLNFLCLFHKSRLVLTDSGGIQEEACIMGIPCVTLRENTERPETLDIGSNVLAGTDPERILDSVSKMMKIECSWKNPFGDGSSGKTIVEIIYKQMTG